MIAAAGEPENQRFRPAVSVVSPGHERSRAGFRTPRTDSDLQKANARLCPPRRGLALVVLAGLASASDAELEHPQDGPHVDLRIEIDDDAVRIKTTVNLAFADELAPPARETLDQLHPVEHDALASALFEALATRTRVTVDGREVAPTPGTFRVFDPDPTLIGLFPVYGARALTQIRLDLDHALDAPPEHVVIAWEAWPEDTAERRLGETGPREVLARLSAGGVESVVTFTEGGEPLSWSASGAAVDHLLPVPGWVAHPAVELPLLSLAALFAALVVTSAFVLRPRRGNPRKRLFLVLWLLVATVLFRGVARVPIGPDARPTEAEVLAAFGPLHANLYRAFDYSDESDVYDALARSVTGEPLERLYAEIYASLAVEEAGGAVGSVQAVTPLATDVLSIELEGDRPTSRIDARWQVEGAVFHWGHSHWRVQELGATFALAITADGWRVTDYDITEQVLISATEERPGDVDEIPEEL